MDTSASPKGTIEKLLGMRNAVEHPIFLQRWAAQAATTLPPGVTLDEVTEHMCSNVQAYMVVSDAEGAPRYVLVDAVKTKVLQKRLRVMRGAQAAPREGDSEMDDDPVGDLSTTTTTPKKAATKATRTTRTKVLSPIKELPQRDSSTAVRNGLLSALLDQLYSKTRSFMNYTS